MLKILSKKQLLALAILMILNLHCATSNKNSVVSNHSKIQNDKICKDLLNPKHSDSYDLWLKQFKNHFNSENEFNEHLFSNLENYRNKLKDICLGKIIGFESVYLAKEKLKESFRSIRYKDLNNELSLNSPKRISNSIPLPFVETIGFKGWTLTLIDLRLDLPSYKAAIERYGTEKDKEFISLWEKTHSQNQLFANWRLELIPHNLCVNYGKYDWWGILETLKKSKAILKNSYHDSVEQIERELSWSIGADTDSLCSCNSQDQILSDLISLEKKLRNNYEYSEQLKSLLKLKENILSGKIKIGGELNKTCTHAVP